ncbi:hypothetical protein M885DRAFT_539410 [Pelagophyceae sp. CCMP2097]|nr:hypothetical protein M885DRAFT_539410 [Pelagophyceae sp. CCMP2097]
MFQQRLDQAQRDVEADEKAGEKADEQNEARAATQHKSENDDASSIVEEVLQYWKEYYLQHDDDEAMELLDFETRHFSEFDPDVEEHSLRHMRLHMEYRALFDRVFKNFLRTSHGVTPEQFFELLRRELDGRAPERERRADDLVALAHKADDYEAFCESMRDAVRQARWFEEPD